MGAVEELCSRSAPHHGKARNDSARTNKLGIPDLAGIELNAERLSVVGPSLADGLVVRALDVFAPAGVADAGLEDALALRDGVVLQEDVLDAPEAACGEGRELGLAVCVQPEGRFRAQA